MQNQHQPHAMQHQQASQAAGGNQQWWQQQQQQQPQVTSNEHTLKMFSKHFIALDGITFQCIFSIDL